METSKVTSHFLKSWPKQLLCLLTCLRDAKLMLNQTCSKMFYLKSRTDKYDGSKLVLCFAQENLVRLHNCNWEQKLAQYFDVFLGGNAEVQQMLKRSAKKTKLGFIWNKDLCYFPRNRKINCFIFVNRNLVCGQPAGPEVPIQSLACSRCLFQTISENQHKHELAIIMIS